MGMNWLKKIGEIGAKSLAIATGVTDTAKAFSSVLPQAARAGVEDALDKAINIITDVETIGASLSIKGPDKFKAAVPLMTSLFMRLPFMNGKKIADPSRFSAGIGMVVSGLAEILSSLDAKKL